MQRDTNNLFKCSPSLVSDELVKPVLKNTLETELWIYFYMLFCPLLFWILLLSTDSKLFMKVLLNLWGLVICVPGVALTCHRHPHWVFSKQWDVYSFHGEKLHGAPLCTIHTDPSPLIPILGNWSCLTLFWLIVTGNGVIAGFLVLETFSWWDKGYKLIASSRTNHPGVVVIREHAFTQSHQQPESFLLFGIKQQHRCDNVHGLKGWKKMSSDTFKTHQTHFNIWAPLLTWETTELVPKEPADFFHKRTDNKRVKALHTHILLGFVLFTTFKKCKNP